MTITPAITEIVTRIKALGISNTYTYEPLTPTGTLMKAKWQDGGILHGCTVRRPTAELDPESETLPEWNHTIYIDVRRTYQDAESQAAHDDEIDDILELFWGDDTLTGTIANIEDVRLVENRPYFFYNVLVHYGRIEVSVRQH